MATHLVQLSHPGQVELFRQTHPNFALFFDNSLDSVCQSLKAPVLAKCAELGLIVASLHVAHPLTKNEKGFVSELPIVTLYFQSEPVASLYETDVSKLCDQIQTVYTV